MPQPNTTLSVYVPSFDIAETKVVDELVVTVTEGDDTFSMTATHEDDGLIPNFKGGFEIDSEYDTWMGGSLIHGGESYSYSYELVSGEIVFYDDVSCPSRQRARLAHICG